MTVLLAHGKRLAWVPWYLGALYACVDECSKIVVWSVGRYDVVSYSDANFLQLFLWERFGALSPTPLEFNQLRPR